MFLMFILLDFKRIYRDCFENISVEIVFGKVVDLWPLKYETKLVLNHIFIT